MENMLRFKIAKINWIEENLEWGSNRSSDVYSEPNSERYWVVTYRGSKITEVRYDMTKQEARKWSMSSIKGE